MKYYTVLFLSITLVVACNSLYNPLESFDEVDDSSSLLLFIDEPDSIAHTLLDQSGCDHIISSLGLVFDKTNNTQGNTSISGNCNGSIVIPSIDLNDVRNFSINFWHQSYSGLLSEILSQGEIDQRTRENAIIIDNNELKVGRMPTNSMGISIAKLALSGEWNMITITVRKELDTDNIDADVYVNSEYIDNISDARLLLPKGQSLILFNNLSGSVDKIRLYDNTLPKNDIQEIYSSEKDFFEEKNYDFPVTEGLEHYITFDNSLNVDIMSSNNQNFNLNFKFDSYTPSGNGFSGFFDGIDDFLSIPVSQLGQYGGFTISFWCSFRSIPNIHPVLSAGSTSNSDVYFAYNQIYAGLSDSIFSFDRDINQIISNKGWKMVTITCSKINQIPITEDLKLYINGGDELRMLNNGSSDLDFSKGSELFFGKNKSRNNFFTGHLDNIRLYNRMLSDDEVKTIYEYEKLQ